VADNRRLLIFTLISVGIFVLWTKVFSGQPAPAPGKESTPPAQVAAPQQGAPAAPAPGPERTGPTVPPPAPSAPEELVTLRSPQLEVTLSSHGGSVKHALLLGEKFRREQGGKIAQIDLVRIAEGQPYPLSLVPSTELGGTQDPGTDPAARVPMRIVSRDDRSVVFEGQVGRLVVRKAYRLTGKPFELALDIEASGGTGAVGVVFPGYVPPDAKGGGFLSGPPLDTMAPICRAGNKTERFKVEGDQAIERVPGPLEWAGIDQHYFVSAGLPGEPGGECVFAKGPVKGSAAAVAYAPVQGGGKRLSLIVYAGPKDLDTLRSYDRGFDTAIDYGSVANLFSFFARILLYVLRWLYGLVRNWGAAIILLTVLVKVILYPLTAKSMQSMQEMRKLQPEIEKLKAKHGSDREKLNMAVMQLYQQHKVNPLGGCLPMLLQLPIWFALYATLQSSVELYREPFLWMPDLTHKDPFYILPIAMGISSFVMQKLSPQPADNTQAKMMLYFFPAFFTILMLQVPGGLTLYIFVNNVLSIVQQQIMMKRAPAPAPAKG
jgi:YidC/Oxa1 family membrane protein insertase